MGYLEYYLIFCSGCIMINRVVVTLLLKYIWFLCFCSSGKTTLSASGTLLPGSNLDASIRSGNTMCVLTVASVIEPFLSQKYRQNISKVWSF